MPKSYIANRKEDSARRYAWFNQFQNAEHDRDLFTAVELRDLYNANHTRAISTMQVIRDIAACGYVITHQGHRILIRGISRGYYAIKNKEFWQTASYYTIKSYLLKTLYPSKAAVDPLAYQ